MQRGNGWVLSTIVGITALGLGVEQQAKAGTFVRSGISFCEVGAVGNRGATVEEAGANVGRGRVDYSYGMSRTEVTVEQFYGFVDAYGSFATTYPNLRLLTRGITLDQNNSSGYGLDHSLRNFAAQMSWRTAAMFCNWLHNDRRATRDAFERGAYDISTFGIDASGAITDQGRRSPDAKFWIPSLDEWLKAAYYDPNRYGAGREGFWSHPGGRTDYLREGYPSEGGESDCFYFPGPALAPFVPVGSYAQVTSPFGLLDTSGGVSEWTEEIRGGAERVFMGSRQNDPNWFQADTASFSASLSPDSDSIGFRLATTIPSPPTLSWLLLAGFASARSRRCD